MTEYKDKTIKCVDCGTEFTFTARELMDIDAVIRFVRKSKYNKLSYKKSLVTYLLQGICLFVSMII